MNSSVHEQHLLFREHNIEPVAVLVSNETLFNDTVKAHDDYESELGIYVELPTLIDDRFSLPTVITEREKLFWEGEQEARRMIREFINMLHMYPAKQVQDVMFKYLKPAPKDGDRRVWSIPTP